MESSDTLASKDRDQKTCSSKVRNLLTKLERRTDLDRNIALQSHTAPSRLQEVVWSSGTLVPIVIPRSRIELGTVGNEEKRRMCQIQSKE